MSTEFEAKKAKLEKLNKLRRLDAMRAKEKPKGIEDSTTDAIQHLKFMLADWYKVQPEAEKPLFEARTSCLVKATENGDEDFKAKVLKKKSTRPFSLYCVKQNDPWLTEEKLTNWFVAWLDVEDPEPPKKGTKKAETKTTKAKEKGGE